MPDLHNKSTDKLFEAVLALESVEECYAFFEDLCTIKELRDMSQRFETAMMLDRQMSYQQIADKTGVSTTTISRVNRCLSYGAGGYRAAIDRLKASEEKK